MKNTAKRLSYFDEGIFSKLNKKVCDLIENNRPVYNLSVGTPDFEPPRYIVETLCKYASEPQNYKYTLCDYPFMLDAVKKYYKSRYGVPLNAENEIISVHGTQEGMGHLGLSLCNSGDIVMLPNPGYPVFEAGARFGDAEIYFYPLLSENKFLPKLAEIPMEILKKRNILSSHTRQILPELSLRALSTKS